MQRTVYVELKAVFVTISVNIIIIIIILYQITQQACTYRWQVQVAIITKKKAPVDKRTFKTLSLHCGQTQLRSRFFIIIRSSNFLDVTRGFGQCDSGCIFSARCNIYISRLCYDVSVRLSVRLSVTFVHCGHMVQWIPDTFACLDRWMSLLLTDNASPGSSDGMMPGFLVEEGVWKTW